jgi:DNA-binding response OmpR family regulator
MIRENEDRLRSWYEDPIVRGLLSLALRLRIGAGLDLIEEMLKSAKKVLIVEYDADDRAILRQQLHHLGYKVLEAATDVEAREQAAKETPDLMILDIMMPQIDGWEVVRELRTKLEIKDLPILVVSGLIQKEDAQTRLDAGYDDILTKPFNLKELREKIQQLLRPRKFPISQIHNQPLER